MKKLRVSATITMILGSISVFAVFFLFLALSDIAHQEEDLSLEWKIAGISMIVIICFLISTFITLGLLVKSDAIWKTE